MTSLYHSWTAAVAERSEQLAMLSNLVSGLNSPLRDVCYAAAILGRFDAQQCGLDELTSQEPERLRREPSLGWPHESALTPFILFA